MSETTQAVVEDLKDRVSKREQAARRAWALAVVDTCAGTTLTEKRLDELAEAMILIGKTHADFQKECGRFKKVGELRDIVAKYGTAEEVDAREKAHLAYAKETQETIERLQKELRQAVAKFDSASYGHGIYASELRQAEADCAHLLAHLPPKEAEKGTEPAAEEGNQPLKGKRATAAAK